MWDEGRLLRIIPHLSRRGIDRTRDRLWRRFCIERGRAAQRRCGLCGGGGGDRENRAGDDGDTREGHDVHPTMRSTLTAHFLKSVCSEIGSVASSVTLFMSWLSSNQGTYTTPRGIRLRPRVSTRVRMNP